MAYFEELIGLIPGKVKCHDENLFEFETVEAVDMKAKDIFINSAILVSYVLLSISELQKITDAYFEELIGRIPGEVNYYEEDGLVFYDFSKLEELDEKEFDKIDEILDEKANICTEEWIDSMRQIMANILGGSAEDYPMYVVDGEGESALVRVDLTNVQAQKMEQEQKKSISISWGFEDVKGCVPELNLTDDEAYAVLKEISERHDAELGVNWDVIKATANDLYKERS